MKTIYIILSYFDTNVCKCLRVFSKEKLPHVSIVMDINEKCAYSFGRRVVRNPFTGGFVKEEPFERINAVYDADVKVLKIDVSDDDYSKMERNLEWFKENGNFCRYNYEGLIFSFFNMPHSINYKYTCTQFVASILYGTSIFPLLKKDCSLVRPSDYLNLGGEVIYIGHFNDFFSKTANGSD